MSLIHFRNTPLTKDPFFNTALSTFSRFPDEFSSLFDAPLSSFVRDTHAISSTAVDVRETPTAYNFVADLPGLKREEVQVQIEDGNILTISGKRTREEKQDTDQWHRVERSTGSFMRRFRLPENSDVDQVKAACQDGVLTVEVPKLPPKQPEQPQVKAIPVD